MKILIAGGAGYIGTRLAFELVKQGHELAIFDNLRYGQKSLARLDNALEREYSLENSFNEKCFLKRFRNFDLKIINFVNKKGLEKEFKKFDVVFHFGEIVGVDSCNKNPHYTENTNFVGSKNVIDLCEKYNCKLIYNSSSSVYGFQETNELLTEETVLPDPTDEYVRNKIKTENYLKTKELDYIIFRPATVSGLSFRMRMELLPHHFTYCLGIKKHLTVSLPEHYRAVIHINDLIKGYLLVLKNLEKIQGQTYNIGNLNLKKIEFVNKIKKLVKNCEVIKKEGMGDVRNLRISSKRFMKEFDYHPEHDFDDIIRPLLKILKKKPDAFSESEYFNEPSVWEELTK